MVHASRVKGLGCGGGFLGGRGGAVGIAAGGGEAVGTSLGHGLSVGGVAVGARWKKVAAQARWCSDRRCSDPCSVTIYFITTN